MSNILNGKKDFQTYFYSNNKNISLELNYIIAHIYNSDCRWNILKLYNLQNQTDI